MSRNFFQADYPLRTSRRMAWLAGAAWTALLAAGSAQAALPLVSACTGASLPASRLTPLLTDLTTGIFTPLVGIPIVGPGLLAGVGGIVNTAVTGKTIGLDVLTVGGGVLTPGSQCAQQADGFSIATPKGITIGGNSIDGLGANGLAANAGEIGSIALGNAAATAAAATNSIALGTGATVTGAAPNAIAIGNGAAATTAGGVALGGGSVDKAATPTAGATIGGTAYTFAGATPTSVVSVGAAGAERQIVNVAAGRLSAASTDAVNGSQLFATNTQVGVNTTAITNLTNGTAGLVQQATPTSPITVGAATGGTAVNVAGTAGPRTITGVAPGALGAGSVDAVNGGQVNGLGASVAAGLGGGAAFNPATGTVTAPSYTVATITPGGGVGAPTTATTVGGAVTSLSTDVTNLATSIGAGTAGTVQRTPVANTLAATAAGGTGAAPGTAQVLTNIAPGSVAAGSTDAVNGGQLAATNAAVTANTTLITNLNNGTAGLVRQATPTAPITLGATSGGTSVDFTGTGGTRTLSGVTAGVAGTDAVNLSQVTGLIGTAAAASPVQYSAAAAPTTPTPGVVSNSTTLVGLAAGTPVALHNVAAAGLSPTSTDAVNGSQLAATNAQTATNTTNIAGNSTAITNLNNGTAGIVQQTGGSPGTGQIVVGGATGGTNVTIAGTGGNRTLTGLLPGLGASDAATVGQLGMVTGGAFNAVNYDTNALGGRTNNITLTGGAPGPVAITNLAPGSLAAGSTDAVTGGQLAATNAQLATNTGNIAGNTSTINQIVSGQAGAFRSNNTAGAAAPVATGANATAGGFGSSATGAGGLALGNGATSTGTGSVAIGQGSTDGGVARVVSVGGVGSERRVANVAAGVSGTDAVNVSQLQAATTSFGTTATGLQNQITQTNFDLNQVRRRANGGTAGAMAVAGLPQAFEQGKTMVGGAFGFWADQVAFAVGASGIVGDNAVVKVGASISGQGIGGFNVGAGWQF